MRAKEVFAAALKEVGMTQKEAANLSGTTELRIGQRINMRETIHADEFFHILDSIGIDTVFYVRKTGALLVKEPKHGKRVTGMSDHVKYDTDAAHLLASSFYADGEHEYGDDGKAQELYVDREGRFFVAEYSCNEDEPDRVRSVPINMAIAFIKQYGLPVKPV